MLFLQRAFLFGLAAASLVTSRATGNAPDQGHILKRGVPEPPGDARVPLEITLGDATWTRQEILDAIKAGTGKHFQNHGVEWQGNKWVNKETLFEGVGAKLTEIDLTKTNSRGKFRAIVSGKKNLVGIIEHAADNNFKSIWDVKKLTREGKWLKLGEKGDRVTGTNKLHYARKDIAAAMQSQAREKVGNFWKSKVSAVSGTSKDVFYVVYDGNEFKHIEDASGAKVYEKQGPACKRDGIKRECGPSDVTESEVEDKPDGPEGEDSPAEPGEEVETPPTEGENPPTKEGETPPSEPTSPEQGEGPAVPEDAETVALAEKFSEEEFANIAASKGMIKSVTETLAYSIKDLRTKALGYKPLTPKSPSFKVRPGKVAAGGANVALGVATVGFWIKGMHDAFKNDVNVLDKTAAVTAIVPFVGCTTNLAAQAWNGDVDGPDTALCYVGDGLLFTPLAPIGIAIHMIRWFISLGKPPKVPEKDVFVEHRNRQWEQFLATQVYTYIYSGSKEASKSKEKSFRAKLRSSLDIQGLAVVSEGAQKIGAAKALAQKSLKASKDEAEKAEIEKGSVQAVEGLRAAAWNETIRRQRASLLELPDALKDQAKASLKPLGEEFNKDYIKNVTSIEMASHYFQADIWAKPGAELAGTKPGNLALVEAQLGSIAAHLKTAPLPLPKTFTLAYILGQSKGLEGVDDRVFSPRDYLSDQAQPKLSQNRINFFSLFHTLEVAKLLHGSIKEDELKNPWKSDLKDARPLHLLIAMKFGKVFEQRKGSGASGPDVPPLVGREGSLKSTPSLAAITGLSEEIVASLPKEGDFLRYKDLISEKMLLAMLNLARSWSLPNSDKEQAPEKAEI